MTNKNLLFSVLIKIAVFAVFFLFCFFNIFQKLDYRLYDSLLHLRKPTKSNDNIMLVKIDDPSILALGEWPWSRDIIADALLRMKELGADTAIFDIEYISPSKNGIAPSAEQKIYDSVNATEAEINSLLSQLTNAIANGYYSAKELPDLTNDLMQNNIPQSFEGLSNYITNNMARDNDEYFAQALQFFGKAYLTINHQNLGYTVTKQELDYIKDRLLINSVQDNNFLINIGNKKTIEESEEPAGFVPALNKLITRAYGANFTNSIIDNDGVRRRMELLYEYEGKYVAQLAFGPYLQIVGSHDVIRQKNEFIVKNAKDPVTGEISDVKIPVDPYGRLLINYKRGSCDASFKNDSIINLKNLDFIEEQIITSLKNILQNTVIGADGYEMAYTLAAKDLYAQYQQIEQFKEYLLSRCTGYDVDGKVIDGISDEEYEQYFGLRNDFYDNIKAYLDTDFLPGIMTRFEELLKEGIDSSIIEEYSGYMKEDFDNLQYDFETYVNWISEMKELYKGAYCIIGNTATSTTDNGPQPFEKKYMNVGIHANVLNTLLTKDFLVQIQWYIGFGFAALLAFLMLALLRLSNAKQNVTSFICYFVYCAVWGGMFVFSRYYIQFIGTIFYLATDLLAGIGFRFYQSNKEKQFITQIAASFANKDTVEELRKNPDAFKTEGQKKCITALFSDVQKFSTLSESIGKMYGDEGPNKLIEILNEYLGQMSNEILRNSGNIDKYEGDAIISMFGAPDPMNAHTKEEWAYLCLDSAIRMKKVEVEFNKMHEDMFKPTEIVNADGKTEVIQLKPLQTRIGINSGEAFVGLMGSKTENFSKLNYTMIGDTVNLASRLEGVNKAYNSWIMCSNSTWSMANTGVHKGEILARRLDRVRVVGRSTPVQLYNIIGFTKEVPKDVREQIDMFHAALELYLQRDFKKAGKLFVQANKLADGDPTSLVFADRCKKFVENGVPKDWDGVVNMTSK